MDVYNRTFAVTLAPAACNRAVAELECSVGRSLIAPPLAAEEVLSATSPPADND